jgi:hypothetical protein
MILRWFGIKRKKTPARTPSGSEEGGDSLTRPGSTPSTTKNMINDKKGNVKFLLEDEEGIFDVDSRDNVKPPVKDADGNSKQANSSLRGKAQRTRQPGKIGRARFI